MTNFATSRIQRSLGFAALPLALVLLNCGESSKEKNSEQANTVQGFPPGGECPNPGSACWVPGYSADCFYKGDPFNCECVPTGLYNAHDWLCEYQGNGGSGGSGTGGTAGSGGSPGGSCIDDFGNIFCGGQSPDGCFCDDGCEQFGDCCPDKFLFCGGGGSGGGPAGSGGSGGGGTPSCIGDFGELFCGGASDDGCFCDDLCEQFGDCCPDKPFVCGGTAGSAGAGGSGGGGEPSCVGDKGELFCGGASDDGCFCDDICEQFGDCCPDKFFVCGGTAGAGGGPAGSGGSGGGGEPSCVGDNGELFCGTGSPDGCFCDDICEQFGDCCPDKFFVCGGTAGSGNGGFGGDAPAPPLPPRPQPRTAR